MGKFRIAALALFVAIAFAGTAYAGSTSANLNVSADVIVWCDISVPSLDFGTYAGVGSSLPMNIGVRCSNTAAYAVSMDAGLNYTAAWRHVSDGAGGLVRYGLYRPGGGEWNDAGYGDTYCCGSPVSGTGSGGWQTLAGTATIFSGYAPAPGAYSDTVVVAVNF